jgi:hypothetical protein
MTSNRDELAEQSADDIAAQVVEEYDLRPYILANGQLGIHFMNLSYSYGYDDDESTLLAEVEEEIWACTYRGLNFPSNEYIDDPEARAHLEQLRDTLRQALAKLDAALGANPNLAINSQRGDLA